MEPARAYPFGDAAASAAAEAAGPIDTAPATRVGPWRVLFVITSSDMGGAEHIVRELAVRLDPSRFAPHVCSLRPAGQIADAIADGGVPVRSLQMAERGLPTELIRGAWRLARWVDEERIDLIHSFLYRGNVAARLAARLSTRRPVVVSGQHSLGPLGGRHIALASRWTRGLADRVVAVSNAVGKAALRIEGGQPQRIVVIPNGIEPERYTRSDGSRLRAELGIGGDAVVVGAVGRLAAEKGVHLVIEAAALARRRGAPLELLLAGDGPERGRLEQQASALQIADHVHFLGTVRDPRPVYAALDIFALPSLEEASPTSLMEAMASGCAIVAASVGGVPEIVDHEHSALLVPPQSPPALADALVRLGSDPVLCQLLRAEARRRVRQDFTLDQMVDRHTELYQQLLEERVRACKS